MILSTTDQAHNFVLYVLDYNTFWEDLNDEALVGFLMTELCKVFGRYQFSQGAMEKIINGAIEAYDNRD